MDAKERPRQREKVVKDAKDFFATITTIQAWKGEITGVSSDGTNAVHGYELHPVARLNQAVPHEGDQTNYSEVLKVLSITSPVSG